MIPSIISQDCSSPGEKWLFDRFQKDFQTENWIILHSLGIAEHPQRLEGEIDFLVMIPNEGILCIEVKAGTVARKNGIWKYGKGISAAKSHRTLGPFKQASQGMHAIRKRVQKYRPELGRLLFFSCVFFTNIYFEVEAEPTEWHKWQYQDQGDLRKPISECCLDILHKAHEHTKNSPSTKWYNETSSRPTNVQIHELLEFLRGDFEFFVSPGFIVQEFESRIRKYTHEQFWAIDALEENPRVLFKGPAGTGKTILAKEATRRSINKNQKTLFICYNRHLGKWLSIQMEKLQKSFPGILEVGTFHKFLTESSKLDRKKLNENNNSIFWKKELPEIVVNKIIEGEIDTSVYDYLVIDEAQDLLTKEYIEVMDLLLKGGISKGKWAFFGDFEKQAIYTEKEISNENILLQMEQEGCQFFSLPLRINCRNTHLIADYIEMVCSLHPGYHKRSDKTIEGDLVDVKFYETLSEQKKLLNETIKELKKKFTNDQIVILSTKNEASCVASKIFQKQNHSSFRPFTVKKRSNKEICYTSIHSYKGLESPAVVLTDIDSLSDAKIENLFYVGVSRAKLNLTVLIDEKCRKNYQDVLNSGL